MAAAHGKFRWDVDGTHRGLYFVHILSAFASGATCFVTDIAVADFGELHRLDEVDTYKPVAPFMAGRYGLEVAT